jgi:hypothetical protein
MDFWNGVPVNRPGDRHSAVCGAAASARPSPATNATRTFSNGDAVYVVVFNVTD